MSLEIPALDIDRPLLTEEQLKQFVSWSKSDRSFRRWVHDRKIPSYKVGGEKRFDWVEVKEVLRMDHRVARRQPQAA